MGIGKLLSNIKNSFNLQAADPHDCNFAVFGTENAGVKTFWQHLDFNNKFRAAEKIADEIASLAKEAGVEDALKTVTCNAAIVLVQCDVAFAEKIKLLPSVTAVKEVIWQDGRFVVIKREQTNPAPAPIPVAPSSKISVLF